MRKTHSFVLVSLMTLGCGVDQSQPTESAGGGLVYLEDGAVDPTSIPSTGPVPKGCVRIEGGEVGQEGLVIDLGDTTVTLTGWSHKDDGPGEAIGFTVVTTGGGVAYAVKAGGETHYGSGSSWAHPGGRGGPEAPGISNITFCPDRTTGGTGAGGTGGGEGGSGGGEDIVVP